jgi:hypothetical protein
MAVRPCKYCGSPVLFDNNDAAKVGKWRPLNPQTLEEHSCRARPRAATVESSNATNDQKWDEIHKRQDERDAGFEKRHDEMMRKMDELTNAIRHLTAAILEERRQGTQE